METLAASTLYGCSEITLRPMFSIIGNASDSGMSSSLAIQLEAQAAVLAAGAIQRQAQVVRSGQRRQRVPRRWRRCRDVTSSM
jgi:hypothetical protein